MAELTPLFMDLSGVYSGDELGLPYRDLLGEGTVGAGDLAVSAGAGNSVNIAAGSCWVVGDTNATRQPCYRCLNDAILNKGINPDGANPRRVLVVAQIVDEGFAGSGRLWRIDTIHGTPAGVPVVPATPASALVLANILVPAAAASSAAYTFTDLRVRAKIGGGGIPGGVAADSITAVEIAANAVGSSELADNAVDTGAIAAAAVTPAKAKLDAAETWNFLGILQSKSMRAHRHPYGGDRHIESGTATTSGNYISVTFTDAFSSAPSVVPTGNGHYATALNGAPSTSGVSIVNGTDGLIWWIAEGPD